MIYRIIFIFISFAFSSFGESSNIHFDLSLERANENYSTVKLNQKEVGIINNDISYSTNKSILEKLINKLSVLSSKTPDGKNVSIMYRADFLNPINNVISLSNFLKSHGFENFNISPSVIHVEEVNTLNLKHGF